MTEGTSQGLFLVVAIVIFGIFVGLSYTLFGSQGGLSNDLENLFTQAFPSETKSNFDKDAEYNVADVVPSEESDFIFDGVDTIIGYIGTSTEVVIPNTIDGLAVTKISGDAFNNKGITKLIMANSITTIEDGSIVTSTAFNNTENVEKESNKLFDSNNAFIMTVSAAEETRTVIGAFAHNDIKEISFSANLDSIGTFAFFSGDLEDVILPEGLASIEESAFEENSITEIEIPATVEKLGDNAFKDNDLNKVTYTSGSKLSSIGSNVFSGNNIKSAEIPRGVTEISDNAYSNSGIDSVTIPKGVTKIGDNAFSNNNLSSVSIPSGVTSIGTDSFSNNKLEEIDIPNTVTIIGEGAFRNNVLEEVVIPESVQEIDNAAFKENILTNVELPTGLQRIGDYAFYKNKLPVVKLPESLLLIGQHAFEYNELLDVTIPSKLTVIREWTFANNKMPSKPSIPTNITTEENFAFYGNLFDEKVTFTDDNLSEAIAIALGVNVEDITQGKLMTLKDLNMSGKSITSLTGLEKAGNLETLDVSNNSITDISLLTNISTLTELNVSNNSITSVSSIGNIKVLNILNNTLNYSSSIYLENLKGLNLTIDKLVVSAVGGTTGTALTEWIVPISDYYLIEVSAAKGGTGGGGWYLDGRYSGSSTSVYGSAGALGSKVVSTVFLDAGEVINIYQGIVGKTGASISNSHTARTTGGSGGGESKIVSTTRNKTLVSAKGGDGGDGGRGGYGGTGIGTNMSINGVTTISRAAQSVGYVLIERVLD